ncbi:MAG: hypothetical protein WD073_09925 [Xanthobacteraceae bacterium]
MSKRRDTATADLFRDFEPKPAVARYAPERVRAATCTARLARAVSETLKDCGHSRDVVAYRISEYLGERVSTDMLHAYSSTAKEKHSIPAHRLVALAVVTGDTRLANALLADTGMIAVDARFEALIRREMAREARDRLDREIAAADAQWRAGR